MKELFWKAELLICMKCVSTCINSSEQVYSRIEVNLPQMRVASTGRTQKHGGTVTSTELRYICDSLSIHTRMLLISLVSLLGGFYGAVRRVCLAMCTLTSIVMFLITSKIKGYLFVTDKVCHLGTWIKYSHHLFSIDVVLFLATSL
jgi:hypothetical protein